MERQEEEEEVLDLLPWIWSRRKERWEDAISSPFLPFFIFYLPLSKSLSPFLDFLFHLLFSHFISIFSIPFLSIVIKASLLLHYLHERWMERLRIKMVKYHQHCIEDRLESNSSISPLLSQLFLISFSSPWSLSLSLSISHRFPSFHFTVILIFLEIRWRSRFSLSKNRVQESCITGLGSQLGDTTKRSDSRTISNSSLFEKSIQLPHSSLSLSMKLSFRLQITVVLLLSFSLILLPLSLSSYPRETFRESLFLSSCLQFENHRMTFYSIGLDFLLFSSLRYLSYFLLFNLLTLEAGWKRAEERKKRKKGE